MHVLLRSLALAGLLLTTATLAHAQDSGALIMALVRKGILTDQEAEDIRAELLREAAVVPAPAFAGGKTTQRLSVGLRLQVQYAHLDTDLSAGLVDPAATNHAFLRRVYFSLRAGLVGDWAAVMTYDFASGGYDDALLEWKPRPDLVFNFGLRKVNTAFEERSTSGNIRSLERSSVTRYFVESNNGRRLAAAGYRIGAFVEGRLGNSGVFYNAAITNPEKVDTFSGASSAGDATTNRPALWAGVGYGKSVPGLAWSTGVGVAHVPDQGGWGTTNAGRGFDLSLYSAFFELTAERYTLMAEFLQADVERGVSATRDAQPRGYFLQPSVFVTETFEVVARYAALDTDGRGVTLGDVIRSAPTGATMNRSSEWYAGFNLYLKGNDLKYQLGLVSAKTKDQVNGGAAEAKTTGVRSQLQVQF